MYLQQKNKIIKDFVVTMYRNIDLLVLRIFNVSTR